MRTVLLFTLATASVVTAALVACDSFPGFRAKTLATAPSASASAGQDTSSPSPSPSSPARDASTGGERVLLRASYSAVEPNSAVLEIDREGVYRLERRGEVTDAGREPGALCTGTLPSDVNTGLWKAIDGAAFAPAESGFAKPIQTARPPAASVSGQPPPPPSIPARYSVIRMLADLSMVPADENGARTLASPIRTTIAAAEKQSASSGTCTKR